MILGIRIGAASTTALLLLLLKATYVRIFIIGIRLLVAWKCLHYMSKSLVGISTFGT